MRVVDGWDWRKGFSSETVLGSWWGECKGRIGEGNRGGGAGDGVGEEGEGI